MKRITIITIITLELAIVLCVVSDFVVKEGIAGHRLLRQMAAPAQWAAVYFSPYVVMDIRELIPAKEENYRYLSGVDEIIIHHDQIFTEDYKHQPVGEIAQYHLGKWNNVGYHYYITPQGHTYYINDVAKTTPHTLGHNSNTIGICLHGDFNRERPTRAQYNALNQLTGQLARKLSIRKVSLHRDYSNTDCPGKFFDRAQIKKPGTVWLHRAKNN